MPITPPVAATPRICSSVRLRGPGQVAATPVCETTTGFVASASASVTDAGETCARSIAMPSACMRADDLAPERREAVLLDARRRACHRIVEEVREPDHAHARGEQAIDARERAVERLRALDAEQPRDARRVLLARREEVAQAGGVADHREPAARARGERVELRGLVLRSREATPPGCERPALRPARAA